MKKIIVSILAIIATSSLFAQNKISDVLGSIEQNNTTLKALRETADAQKLANRTGIFLSDPEIGFNYLWGNPSSAGNRQDINVTQSFDFPTISGLKSKVANKQNELVEWQYKADRMNILLEAKQYCLDLIYYNALLQELSVRLGHAEIIAAGQKERLDRGDGNIMEYNNVQLNLSTVKGEITRITTERNAVISQLVRLNGGSELTFKVSEYEQLQIPNNFVDWFVVAEQKNPVLSYVKQEIELSRKQVSLSKSMNLPTFSAGFMSENVIGQRYQGVSVGVSIPLWANKNRVKQAKSAVRAAESRQTDTKQQFYSQLEILYQRTYGLKLAADTYRTSLANANNSSLLKKALDAGQISILDYIVEMGLYYNTVTQTLEAERDYQKAFAELSAVEL
ncbi:MAG: TolC family protein [Paludibacter sp.]|nr:TolC family protein [Prevotella sp.]MBP7611555.1 TolC family protein [Paludibacter sp.]MBP8687574.1 TolC family protein [Prevotella sp.]